MTEPVTGARLHVPVHLRWGDLDAYDHVNNVSLLKLLEEARIRAIWKASGGQTHPTAVVEPEEVSGVQTVVARQEIEYLSPVPYGPEPLDVELWFGHLGGSSAEICYEVYSPVGEEPRTLYARASAVLVVLSAETGKPARLTEPMRTAWTEYAGAPIAYGRRR
ncbi:acyl-CoA thioesterase [Microbacterium sp. No. 7]|uniref:acyl-CoA thioesterase n=1 Tax=Microbacterium sp. No. 7 TaxID=1714373 RepID=UPI0006ED3DCD|nr:thioesterase family protein [Microbacterium sp. No. 7]ALJ20269.1 4-hydroxybenzoyl-CoA thioesterase [Microbacterium sp. No. 7]